MLMLILNPFRRQILCQPPVIRSGNVLRISPEEKSNTQFQNINSGCSFHPLLIFKVFQNAAGIAVKLIKTFFCQIFKINISKQITH